MSASAAPLAQSALVWFRRDLRAHDHAALSHALAQYERVWCVFVFDTDILQPLLAHGLEADRRVEFIRECLLDLHRLLAYFSGGQGGLIVRHGRAVSEIPRLAAELGADVVFANRDYEPAAIARDAAVARALRQDGRGYMDFKDQVIFERDEVMTQGGLPFSVFTPYKNAWLKKLDQAQLEPFPVHAQAARLAPAGFVLPSLAELGFRASNLSALKLPLGCDGAQALLRDFCARIDDYAERRDYPARKGPSYLSVHLRFGTLSIRQLVAYAWGRLRVCHSRGAEVWLGELIWREFYQQILWHHPRVVTQSFKPDYERIIWDEAPALLAAWSEGRTGYPLIDAAMRQLNQSGYMHNRLRMVTASFLTKDLGLSWQAGERIFAERLLDYDLASNNGGWQWAASTGCDAQPYFRIFNPVTQSQKFDPQGAFIRRYVPELARMPDKFIHAPWTLEAAAQTALGIVVGRDYPAPVVDHAAARVRTLARFGR